MRANTILQIGSQQFIPMNDCYRYVIQKVIPQKDLKFAFSIRKASIDRLIREGTKLEVTFREFPNLSFKFRPEEWRVMGTLKKEVRNFKDHPMPVLYYYVNFAEQLTKQKVSLGQGNLYSLEDK